MEMDLLMTTTMIGKKKIMGITTMMIETGRAVVIETGQTVLLVIGDTRMMEIGEAEMTEIGDTGMIETRETRMIEIGETVASNKNIKRDQLKGALITKTPNAHSIHFRTERNKKKPKPSFTGGKGLVKDTIR